MLLEPARRTEMVELIIREAIIKNYFKLHVFQTSTVFKPVTLGIYNGSKIMGNSCEMKYLVPKRVGFFHGRMWDTQIQLVQGRITCTEHEHKPVLCC